MPEFCSFLVFRSSEIKLIHSICLDANWTSRDISDPSERYVFRDTGWRELAQASELMDIEPLREGQQYGRLLILETDQTEADNIIQLICAANLILEGFPDPNIPSICGFPLSDNTSERRSIFESVFRSDGFFQYFTYRKTLPVAVALAARAWGDMKLVYAIHKLADSYRTESVSPWSMHPRYGQVFEKHSDSFASHVRTSIAINLAYSAIEELGFGVRASKNKPRNIGGKNFVWNPEVLEPFEARLKQAGIDPAHVIDWITRGKQTEVEIYEMLDRRSDYSDGTEIRDRQVSLPNAINFCEYLRNTMTAHAFSNSNDTPRLGPYEVYNTQQVARFMILSKCNLWCVCTGDLRSHYC